MTITGFYSYKFVYAQQENISSMEDTTENSLESTEISSSAARERTASLESQSEEERLSDMGSQKTPQLSYQVQLTGQTKLERKELNIPLEKWENVELQIEEVYVRSGNTLKAGDPIFKISTESMQKLLEYYNNQVDAAQAKVEDKQFNYEIEKNKAEYEKEQAKQAGANAKSVKESKLQSLQGSLTGLKTQIETTSLELESYKKALNDKTYYTEYGIADMLQAVTNSKSIMENAQRTLSKIQSESSNTDSNTLQLLRDLVKQAEDSYQLIQQQYNKLLLDYGKKVSEAQVKINELQEKLTSLQEEYNKNEAVNQNEDLEINQNYEEALLVSNQAERRYNITVEALDAERVQAQKELEKWTKIREKLYAMEDGMVYASEDMTVASFSYHNGDLIEKERSLLTYDAAAVSVVVRVPQQEIIEWNVGDTVMVEIEGCEQRFIGTVASMDLQGAAKNNNGDIEYTAVISVEQGEEQIASGQKAVVLSGEIVPDSSLEEETQIETSSDIQEFEEVQEEETSSQETSESVTELSGEQLSESTEG